jgi:hypothetical protein
MMARGSTEKNILFRRFERFRHSGTHDDVMVYVIGTSGQPGNRHAYDVWSSPPWLRVPAIRWRPR